MDTPEYERAMIEFGNKVALFLKDIPHLTKTRYAKRKAEVSFYTKYPCNMRLTREPWSHRIRDTE